MQDDINSVSLEAQQNMIQGHVGFKLSANKIVHETGSAYKSGGQKKLRSLMDSLPTGSELYVYCYDRFSRNCLTALKWIEELGRRGIKIISVKEPLDYSTATGRNHFMTIISSAECQSRITGEKLSMAREYRKKLGGISGTRASYGYRIVNKPIKTNLSKGSGSEIVQINTIEVDPFEKRVTTFIIAMRNGEHKSAKLNELLFTNYTKITKLECTMKFCKERRNQTTQTKGLSFGNIANLLNEYKIKHRQSHPKWTTIYVRRIYNQNLKPNNKSTQKSKPLSSDDDDDDDDDNNDNNDNNDKNKDDDDDDDSDVLDMLELGEDEEDDLDLDEVFQKLNLQKMIQQQQQQKNNL